LIAQRDPVKHLDQRKPWNRAFSSAALKEYEVTVAKRTRQLLGCLENLALESDRKDGAVLDMAAWFNYFTYVRSNIGYFHSSFLRPSSELISWVIWRKYLACDVQHETLTAVYLVLGVASSS